MDDWLVKLNMYVHFTQSDSSSREGLLESRRLLQSGSFILLLVARPPQDSFTLFVDGCTILLRFLALLLVALPVRVNIMISVRVSGSGGPWNLPSFNFSPQ